MADNIKLPEGAKLIETNNTVNLPKGATLISSKTVNNLPDFKGGLLANSFDTRNQLSEISAQNDTSGIRPSLYKLPSIETTSQAENIIKNLYTPDFLQNESDDNMSFGKLYQKQNAELQAQDKIDFLKAKTHPDGTPISKQEKDVVVKELLDLQDLKSKEKRNNLSNIRNTYLPLLNQYRDSYASEEEINSLNKEYQDKLNKSNYDIQEADKRQKLLMNYLPEIVQLNDQFTEGAKNDINYLDKFTDEQLKQSFGELGIDKSYISNVNTTDNAEAAKIAYNQKSAFFSDVYSLKNVNPANNTQIGGNPKWVNEAFQKQGGYQVLSNFQDLYKQDVEKYNNSLEEYSNLVDNYNNSPSKQSLDELNKYKNEILNPIKQSLEKRQDDLKRLYRIQETSYGALDQWQNKQKEQENLDLSSTGGQFTAAFRSLANKNTHMLAFPEQMLSLPFTLVQDKDSYLADRISYQNRLKDNTYIVPEKYHSTPIWEDFDEKNPKGFFERVNWANLAAKNLETTAFSLEIAGVTMLSGGGSNAIIPTTFMMTYGDALYNARENGFNETQASTLAAFQSLIEGVTERISPLEAKIFNPSTYTSGTFKQLSKKEVIQQLYRNITKKEINDSALDALIKITSTGAKNLGKASLTGAYTVLQETAEELSGDILNGFVDVAAANNIQGYEYEPITLESLKNTAITSASTMALMGLWGAGTELINPQVSSYHLDLATNPELHIESLYNSLNSGMIPDMSFKNGISMSKNQFVEEARKNIENLSSLYKTNKDIINNLDEKYQQSNYIGLLVGQNSIIDNISKFSVLGSGLNSKQEKQLETLKNQLLDYQKEIQKYNNIAFENISLSKEDREKNQESKVFESTSKQFNDEYINSLVFPQQIQAIQTNLTERYTYAPSDRMKNLVEELNIKLSNRLGNIQNKPTSEVIQEVNNKVQEEQEITKQQEEQTQSKTIFEQESEKIQTLNKDKISSYKIPKEIKGEERKQLIQAKNEREKQLEDIENTISFEGKEGKQNIQKGQWVQIEGQNNVYKAKSFEEDRFTASFADDSQDISINPKDYKVTPISQEEAEKILNSKVSTSQEKKEEVISKNISSDIEAKKADIERRRQEELSLTSPTIQWDVFGNESLESWNIEERTKTRGGQEAVVLSRMVKIGDGVGENGSIAQKKVEHIVPISDLLDFINAKYDAELAALEDTEIVITPTQEQVDLQTELDRIIEDNSQEVQKEVVKNQETKKPKYYPFSTRPIGIDIQDDIVGKVAQNSLRWLNNQIKSTGKSITDQGYFITVFDVNDSKLKSEWFPQRTQEYWKTNAKKGKVAVITDKEGNIKFFSENGEVSETGTWSMHWIPDLNTLNKPTFEGNNAEQRSKQWELDKEKLSKLRDIKEPTIIEIERIISQPVKVLETPIKLIEAYNNPDSYTIKVQGLESSIVTPQGEFPIILSNKIDSVPNIAEDIYEFLNLNNSEGLPDAWKTNSKDKQERLKVFKSRLGFSLTPGTSNKTFPEIILLTSPSLRQFRLDADTNLPYIVDHLNKKEYRTKEEFVEFVNSQILNISNFINSQSKQSDVNLNIYRFKDGKFTTEQRPYKQLIADNFNIKVEQPIENPYIKFGKGVKKLKDEPVDKPIEQKPQLEQPQKVETKIVEDEFNFDDIAPAEDTLDDINDTEGLNRVKTLKQKVTTKQEAEAQTWFESYLAKSGATFNDSREIANSTAFANWKNGAITLWKSGKYTDLYHEAWHDFTQMFLTPEQKKALYNEAEKSEEGQKVIQGKETELEKFFALEEMLAEDFYKYQLSGQKLILGQRVKRNTIFRKIYNFLKELLTGKPSIERLYRQLANQNINIAKRDIANAMFGTLNKSIEGLSIKDSLNLYKAIDSMIASQIKNRSISISQIFLEKGYLNKTYGTVKNSLLESAKELAAQYKQNPTSDLKYTLDNLSYTLRNWESVKESHRINSKFLKVSKDLLLEEIDEEGNEVETNVEKYGDARDESNPIDNVSQYILYMIASLPDVKIINGVKTDIKNQFLPNVTDTVDFGRAWGQLAKNLEGDKDYTSMYNKIDKLSKTQPSFEALLSLLPNPNKDLNRYELQLKSSFINALSKPLVNLKTTSIEYVGDRVNIMSRNAEFITFKQLAQDWDLALQEIPNEYTNEDSETSQRSLNLDKILNDFKVIRKDNSKDFLSALGFTFSEATLSSPELQSILNIENRKLKDIYNALKSYKELQDGKYSNNLIPSDTQISSIKKPIFKPTEVLSRSIYVNKQSLFSSVKKVIDELLEIELNHSEKYHGDSVTNSEGNNQWLHKDWSLQSQDYSLLNNIEKFPTYQHLILDPLGKYFDIDLNPDANNIFINSLFVLDVPKTDEKYGQRRIKGKTPITLELFDQNGLRISVDETSRDGLKTSRLPRFLALIADLPTLLTTGEKQHLRYGDKSTSRGTKTIYPSFVKNTIKNDIYLPVDISDFSNPDKISEQAWIILSNSLKSALQITNNQTANNQYQNVANLPLNIEKSPFGTFDKILSKETKELLRLAHSNEQIDINSLVNSYRFNIEKDIVEFFKNDTKVILNELNANPYITEKDYIPEKLLNNYPKEQLIRAFSMNSWIINTEHIRAVFQDQRYYDIKIGKKSQNYKEPFKRFSKASSTGTIAINDYQINNFFNSVDSGSFAEKVTYDKNNPDNPSKEYVEEGIVNSIIVSDVTLTPEEYANSLLEKLKNAPKIEQEAVKGALGGLKVTDAMAVCTFDWYRNMKLRIGEEAWSDESEKLYQKIARGEQLTQEDELNSYLFFPPMKFRSAGRVYDEQNNVFIPIDYKYAITPLLSTVVKGKSYEAIKNNMIRQNVSLLLFQSASKHSAITNNGKYNTFYQDGKPYTGDYTINPVPVEYFYEVVNSPDYYKEESRYSTQLRTILFVNLFDNGIPRDVDRYKMDWNSLSESEKKKISPSYKRAVDFRDSIDDIIRLRKEKLLNQIEASYNPETDSFTFNEVKLSSLLEREFDRKNLPFNVISSIQIQNGKFKFAFDATIARDEIENVILSIIDNKLRKQDVYGESLIQASSAGFETNIDEKLDFYKNNGRTKKDGTKVTSAHKIKISLQGDFKKLLQHPDVLDLSSKQNITPLQALNQLIRDENWLDKGNNRKFITTVGVRIPVQGLNSMEFMEVDEFLPTEAGSIVVVSPELVAKSGGDFDWDKITSYFPHLFIDNNGDIQFVERKSDAEIEELYDQIANPLKQEIKDILKTRKITEIESKEVQTIMSSNNLISSIFGESDIRQLIEDSFGRLKEGSPIEKLIPSKKQFVAQYKEKEAHNQMIDIMREILEDSNNFVNLVLPNATYMFEDIADDRKAALQTEVPGYADNGTVRESLNQHESNFVGKDALGIGAIANKFFPLMQQVGMYLNNEYASNLTYRTIKYTRNRFPHNEINIDGTKHISVSGVYSVEKGKGNKYKISEAISQLMNGWVDVAKKDWIFYINGRKELAPTMLFHLIQGTHKDDVISFFNQPVLYDYIKELNNLKNPLIRLKDRELYNSAKKNAIYNILMKYIPDSQTISVKRGKKIITVNLKEELTSKFEGQPQFFYGFVNNQLRELADNHPEFFNDEKFNYHEFAIPQDGKLKTPKTDKEKLAQALYLIQYLELEEQTNLFSQMRKTLNNDTSKASSFQYSKARKSERDNTLIHGLFPTNLVDKLINQSVLAGFTNDSTGLDTFIQQFSKNMFELTNHPIFNSFLFREWSKPELSQFDNQTGQMTVQGNNIPFENRGQDDFSKWVRTLKNDFILYIYANSIYDENDIRVSNKVFRQLQYPTALAHDLEQLKRDFPNLVKNNMFLQYLVKDNSTKLNSQNKPTLVNIKLKYSKLDKDNSDIITQDFSNLLNFNDGNYTIDEQLRIQTFAKSLADFAYIQSGLNNTPVSFAKYIPQDVYARDMQDVIVAFKEVFDNNPKEANKIVNQFYNLFRRNNPSFYIPQEDEFGNKDIVFNQETSRYKEYRDYKFYDILNKKLNKSIEQAKKKTSTLPNYKVGLAQENPKTLFVFEDSLDNKITGNSANITLVQKGKGFSRPTEFNKPENTQGITLLESKDKPLEDKFYNQNESLIEQNIRQILQLTESYDKVVFPDNLFDNSKLKENSPKLYNLAANLLNEYFGLSLELVEDVIFETNGELSQRDVLDKNIENFVNNLIPGHIKNDNDRIRFAAEITSIIMFSRMKDRLFTAEEIYEQVKGTINEIKSKSYIQLKSEYNSVDALDQLAFRAIEEELSSQGLSEEDIYNNLFGRTENNQGEEVKGCDSPF